MANLIPVISVSAENAVYLDVSGLTPNPGDRIRYSDIAAALSAAGAGWQQIRSRCAATYASAAAARDVFRIEVTPAQITVDADGLTLVTTDTTAFYLYTVAAPVLVRASQRACTIRMPLPQGTTQNVWEGSEAWLDFASVAALLPAKSAKLKALLAASYASFNEWVDACGVARMTLALGPGEPTYDGRDYVKDSYNVANNDVRIRMNIEADDFYASGEYAKNAYFTFDLGQSIAR